MKLYQVVNYIEKELSLKHAQNWDNVGLISGDLDFDIKKIISAIDCTNEVVDEAIESSADLIFSYHPPIFDGLKKISSKSPIFKAIRNNISIYSPHTILDVIPRGLNDLLADAINLTHTKPLLNNTAKTSSYKLVTFVPKDSIEKVSSSLFEKGAGEIGKYSSCSFRQEGIGTFLPNEGANPAYGKINQLESIEEYRLEVIVPISKIDSVVFALKSSHPYDEVAYDLYPVIEIHEGYGLGRVGFLKKDTYIYEIIKEIKDYLGISTVFFAGNKNKKTHKVAVSAGSCSSEFLNVAIKQNVDLYITGEMRHHDAIKATQNGVSVICTLHSNSERKSFFSFSKELFSHLKKENDIEHLLSTVDADPFSFI